MLLLLHTLILSIHWSCSRWSHHRHCTAADIVGHNWTYIPPVAFKGGNWNAEHGCVYAFRSVLKPGDCWFRTGDLAVTHPDGYLELKDRAKDIIISGGENISSIEVEDVLFKHPQVIAAAVVARPDEKWGETPCAFVELKTGASAGGLKHKRRTNTGKLNFFTDRFECVECSC